MITDSPELTFPIFVCIRLHIRFNRSCNVTEIIGALLSRFHNTPSHWNMQTYFYLISIPMFRECLPCPRGPTDLVFASATMSSVGPYCNTLCFDSTISLVKWYSTSVCFVISFTIVLQAEYIAPLLSPLITSGLWLFLRVSCNTLLSQTPSREAYDIDAYSPSCVHCATMDCFLLRQDTAPPHLMNRWPLAEFVYLLPPTKSPSAYPRQSALSLLSF